jgi:quercetin dioxygenase-like cupin family protein
MEFFDTNQQKAREIIKGFFARFIHTDANTLSFVHIDNSAILPSHAHPHDQVTFVIEGQLEVTLAGETRILSPGMAFHAPTNVPHSARALTACYVVDVFNPVREDFK